MGGPSQSLWRLSADADERSAHSLPVAKPDNARDGLHRFESFLDLREGCLRAQALDGVCRRTPVRKIRAN
jgi:hypothetical protein